MTRSTTEPIVLETVYGVAGITPPANTTQPAYSGYPLATRPQGVAIIFYVAWPVAVVVLWLLTRWPRRMLAPVNPTLR
jgi:hypothetical protein